MQQISSRRNSKRWVVLVMVVSLALAAGAARADGGVAQILERFVEDYREDGMAIDGSFGVRVDGEWWHVTSKRGADGAPNEVTLGEGQPPEPTFFFFMDKATLERLDAGTLAPGTAMVKAFSTDESPMDADAMEGFQPDETFLPTLLKATFHFWVRGFPEITVFGDEHTRFTHGADAGVFYYQPGLRSGWFSIKPGQHANEDPRSQENPFPSLFIVIDGKGMARIGGKELEVSAGQSVFIGPNVAHEFWNPFDEPVRGILLMFGEGA
jgi:mannose-6-phosphate isomerase-like protein (cupin superfamily)